MVKHRKKTTRRDLVAEHFRAENTHGCIAGRSGAVKLITNLSSSPSVPRFGDRGLRRWRAWIWSREHNLSSSSSKPWFEDRGRRLWRALVWGQTSSSPSEPK
ncbi:hypothetical protein TIFTF001_005192 [Ficus carica]|uniref:Uncharacterized protein n=1 Tax=Ficus carica TaxID=3494 RepID=A0AA87ZXI7_FICCA|nr:hypothetical protein TIFTF001_005192 [Ficus carica]